MASDLPSSLAKEAVWRGRQAVAYVSPVSVGKGCLNQDVRGLERMYRDSLLYLPVPTLTPERGLTRKKRIRCLVGINKPSIAALYCQQFLFASDFSQCPQVASISLSERIPLPAEGKAFLNRESDLFLAIHPIHFRMKRD